MLFRRLHNILKLFASFAFLCLTGIKAGAQTDSLYLHLDSTTFSIHKHTSAIRGTSTGATLINTDLIQSLPKILGNTDPVNFIRQLPGVQTNSEYDAGIHIQGCDNSHNLISISDVPVFGPNHIFGLFSVFIPSHHEQMTFATTVDKANRLGGTLNMELPDTLKETISGYITAGMMSSQGTLRARIGNNSHLRISARNTYINALYKRWLKVGDNDLRYGFSDCNLTWLYAADNDKLWVDMYMGRDLATLAESHFDVGLSTKWGNALGAIHWEHKGDVIKQRHSTYYSGYLSDSHVTQSSSTLDMDSYINAFGYKGQLQWNGLTAGADVTYYHIQPQNPQISGIIGAENIIQKKQNSAETSLHAEYNGLISDNWSYNAGLKASAYISPEKEIYTGLSPKASVTYNTYIYGKIKASYNLGRQYLFQTGLSNIGFPIEFWIAAGEYSAPQYSHNFNLSYDAEFFRDALAVSVSTYYKRLYNQIQYSGNLFDLFNSIYDLNDNLLKGDGWNYGVNMMVHKQSGDLTGWISYSLGRALRQFDDPKYQNIYPANHERIHELNAVVSYKMDKWDLGSTFVFASGIPFTAAEHFYISSGQLLAVYGDHNACRMRPYIRLDLSATYMLTRNQKQENGINISLYNALGRYNDVMYRIATDDVGYRYTAIGFFLQLVPSVSYYHKF